MSLQQELQQMCDGINAYVEALENKEPWALERERQFNERVAEARAKNLENNGKARVMESSDDEDDALVLDELEEEDMDDDSDSD